MQSHYLNVEGDELRLPSEFQYSGPRSIDILSLKADYVKPFSEKSKLEAGFKTGQTATDNQILYENYQEGMWEIDLNQSNNFKYSEHISAVYTTYSHKFGKISAMAGLRTEYTYIKGESFTMDTSFARSYIGWFPSAYLQYKINDKQGLNLSYSRKIHRPGYSLLNPFRTYIDPFTFQSGNPDLNPSHSNTIGFRYSFSGYSLNISYNVENKLFEQDYIQDDENHTMGLVKKNIGKKQELTLGAFFPIQVVKWYRLNIYSGTGLLKIDTRHNGERFRRNYISASMNLQHNFTILQTMRANMQMMWIKLGWQGIVRFEDYLTMNANIEKTFFDKRLSLALSCNDIFSSIVIRGKINFGNINQTLSEDKHLRQTMLTARYTFGSQKIRAARNRSVGIENEMGRAK
jgi:hypothetical protein